MTTPTDDPNLFLGKLFMWCFNAGVEVSMVDSSFRIPRSYEPLASDNIRMPRLRFSRADKHMEVQAWNWPELIEKMRQQYKYIFMELCVPLGDF